MTVDLCADNVSPGGNQRPHSAASLVIVIGNLTTAGGGGIAVYGGVWAWGVG